MVSQSSSLLTPLAHFASLWTEDGVPILNFTSPISLISLVGGLGVGPGRSNLVTSLAHFVSLWTENGSENSHVKIPFA